MGAPESQRTPQWSAFKRIFQRNSDGVSTSENIGNISMGRRRFIVGGGLGIATSTGLFEFLTHPELFDTLGLLFTNPDVIPAAQDLLRIIENQPSPEKLREDIVHRGIKIDVEKERQKVIAITNGGIQSIQIRVRTLGDSDVYTFGTMHDGNPPDPQDQPHSFAQVAAQQIDPYIQDVGIQSWESNTNAVPGAPSGKGYQGEKRQYGLLGPEQFANSEIQRQLRDENQPNVLDIINIVATGDDWRELMQNALLLAHFYSKLENVKHATKKDVEEFKALLTKSNDIAKRYGENLTYLL